jgi:hypothetical protein
MAHTKTHSITPQRSRWTPCANVARITILRRGYTYGRLATLLQDRGYRCTEFNVANVVRGFTKRPDLRAGISDILAIPVERLWPERRAY